MSIFRKIGKIYLTILLSASTLLIVSMAIFTWYQWIAGTPFGWVEYVFLIIVTHGMVLAVAGAWMGIAEIWKDKNEYF